MQIVLDRVQDELIYYLRKKLLIWGRDNYYDFPWRHENNAFHSLISEILLQRTRAEQVVRVYLNFKKQFPDPASLAKADIKKIEDVIAPLGLKWRATYLSELGTRIMAAGNIPLDIEALQELPGVGRYSASAYLSLHAGKRAAVVDSNIVRFYGRFFGFKTETETRRDKSILHLADHITPKRVYRDFNYGLIDFTRTICKPKVNHMMCPIRRRCLAALESM